MTEILRCKICERRRADKGEFCDVHETARRNLDGAYEKWFEAYDGKLAKSEFYERIIGNDGSGEAVVEVASHLLSSRDGDRSR